MDTGTDDDPGVVSTSRVDYDPDGGGVIVTNTTDRNTGETSTTVTGFDKDGNPRDVGPGGGDGGGDPPEPDGGDDGEGGGGDEMPADDGGGGDDTGPSIHFGGLERPGGLADLGSVMPPGAYGGDDGEGEDVGPTRFERMKEGLLAAAGMAFDGDVGGADGWEGGGPDDGPRQPVIHFSGLPGDVDLHGRGLAVDNWGDLSDPRALVAFAQNRFGLGNAAAGRAADSAARMAG